VNYYLFITLLHLILNPSPSRACPLRAYSQSSWPCHSKVQVALYEVAPVHRERERERESERERVCVCVCVSASCFWLENGRQDTSTEKEIDIWESNRKQNGWKTKRKNKGHSRRCFSTLAATEGPGRTTNRCSCGFISARQVRSRWTSSIYLP